MAIYGGPRAAFNDNIVGASLGSGIGIGSALLQGVLNYRHASQRAAHQDAVEKLRKHLVALTAHGELTSLRLNREVDRTRTQALVIEAQRREIERLQRRRQIENVG